MFILMRSDGRILKYLTRVFLIGTILRKYALAENGKSGNCDVKTVKMATKRQNEQTENVGATGLVARSNARTHPVQ